MKAVSVLLLLIFGIPAQAARVDLSPSIPWDSALNISPKVKYTQASIFGQGSVPTYKGFAYGGEMEYVVGTPDLSLGPFVEMLTTSLDNTASTSAQKENLQGTFTTAGLKLYTNFTYLKIGGSQMRLKDRATGTINNTKTFKSTGLELGAGLNYTFNDYVASSIGLDIAYFKISPSDNNIQTRLDYMSYSLVFSLRFAVPSGSGN